MLVSTTTTRSGHVEVRDCIYLGLSIIDPKSALTGFGLEERLIASVGSLLRFSRCAIEADIRWIRAQLTAYYSLEVKRWSGNNWVMVDHEETAALLNPMAHDREGMPSVSRFSASEPEIAAARIELLRQREADKLAARSAWSNRFPDFRESLACRLKVVEEEGPRRNRTRRAKNSCAQMNRSEQPMKEATVPRSRELKTSAHPHQGH